MPLARYVSDFNIEEIFRLPMLSAAILMPDAVNYCNQLIILHNSGS
jgi:hypothetical protein